MAIVTDHPLANGFAPEWAAEWGDDEYGPWAAFQIGQVTQALRWIPPGRFMMGSEKPDPDWDWTKNECPRHWVTLTCGFWMFDSPVTQELWEAVTGENPSHFKEAERPVEQVSWNEAKQFMQTLGEQINGLSIRLPTEAEWEYACRAGTETDRYGELDDVAWCSQNSDSETHAVKKKDANPWGLYDMLGNVWEWCEDRAFRTYVAEGAAEPVNDSADDRVIRGGSWFSSAADVRAAFRLSWRPEDRYYSVGFRCLSSPEPRPARRRLGAERERVGA